MSQAKFPGGAIVRTPNALAQIPDVEMHTALVRHFAGDWGEVCPHDRHANEAALRDGLRLFSVYRTRSGKRFWIITEADRSATTVLMPEDY